MSNFPPYPLGIKVRITENSYTLYEATNVGKVGTLTDIESEHYDGSGNYFVSLGPGKGGGWVTAVEPVGGTESVEPVTIPVEQIREVGLDFEQAMILFKVLARYGVQVKF